MLFLRLFVLFLGLSLTPLRALYASTDNPTDLPFMGMITEDAVRIRADSTITSEIIGTVDKGQTVEVIRELYGWYKIKLPQTTVAFISKKFLSYIGAESARINADRVNIRLQANTSSPIIGKVSANELVKILEDHGEWAKIQAPSNTFGWIHTKFVTRNTTPSPPPAPQPQPIPPPTPTETQPPKDLITVEGLLKPKFITQEATHKLITHDRTIYLLKGNIQQLNSFNHKKVKVTGIRNNPYDSQPLDCIEVQTIELIP
jgi:SH3-like domain-containing protein